MAKTRRVVFSFDERSLESLQKLTEQGKFSSMADTVRESLQINRALQSQAQQGFTEVVVRNPETNKERVLVIPNLQAASEGRERSSRKAESFVPDTDEAHTADQMARAWQTITKPLPVDDTQVSVDPNDAPD